jgi:hypothetical protein
VGRHHRRWGILSTVAAAGVIAAGTAWGLGSGAEPASANGTDGQFCTANQITATMVRETWNPGLHDGPRSYGAIQIRANDGEGCHIAGAPDATLQGTGVRAASDNSAPRTVLVTPTGPAWIPLDWSDESSPSAQQIPSTITLDLAGNKSVVVPWVGGGVDAVAGDAPADPVRVRGVRPGVAPYPYH